MTKEKIIKRVWERKTGTFKQKLITIPAKSDIKAGDMVEVKKIK
jgi:hypothetical protein